MVLRMTIEVRDAMVAHALAGLPFEACGLLGSDPADSDVIRTFVPCRNTAESAVYYVIGREGWERADRILEPLGQMVVGMMHSHTHTDPFPSATDIEEAANPLLGDEWRYLIVSLRDASPIVRSYRITEASISEEPIQLIDR